MHGRNHARTRNHVEAIGTSVFNKAKATRATRTTVFSKKAKPNYYIWQRGLSLVFATPFALVALPLFLIPILGWAVAGLLMAVGFMPFRYYTNKMIEEVIEQGKKNKADQRDFDDYDNYVANIEIPWN